MTNNTDKENSIPEKWRISCPLDHSTFEKFTNCDCNYGGARDVWWFKEQQIHSLKAELEIATNAGLEAQERVKEYDTILNDNYFILNQNKKLKAELEKANSEINARVSDVEFWKKNAEYFDECCREKDPVITDLDVELEKARELIREELENRGIKFKNREDLWDKKAKEFLRKEGE